MLNARFYKPGEAKSILVHPSIEGNNLKVSDEVSLPLAGLYLKLGGQTGDRVTMQCLDDDSYLLFDTPDVLQVIIAGCSERKLVDQARKISEALKGKKHEPIRYWGTVFGAIVALVFVANTAFNLFVDWSIDHFDPKLEGQIGHLAARHTNWDKNAALVERVRKIGAKLVANLDKQPFEFDFHVEESKEVNAFAYPGGVVVIYSTLVKASGDDELACILGHEIGHVIHHHALAGAIHSLGISAGLGLLCGVGSDEVVKIAEALSLAKNLGDLKFSRGQEAAADLTGIDLAYKAGYDPNGLIVFFEQMQKQSPGENQFMSLLSDHPLDSEREAAAKKEIERIKKGDSIHL